MAPKRPIQTTNTMNPKPPSLLLRFVGKLPFIGALLKTIVERNRLPEPPGTPDIQLPPIVQKPDLPPDSPPASQAKPARPKATKRPPAASATGTPKNAQAPDAPACPHCRKTMVIKVARSGANAGGQFWGCPAYPQCRGIRAIFAPMPSGRR